MNKQIEKPKEQSYITVNGIEYYFDGIIAYPVKCNCDKKDNYISEQITEIKLSKFNHETKMYDIYEGSDMLNNQYNCSECFKRHRSLEWNKNKWVNGA